jgi:hypothetical protein
MQPLNLPEPGAMVRLPAPSGFQSARGSRSPAGPQQMLALQNTSRRSTTALQPHLEVSARHLAQFAHAGFLRLVGCARPAHGRTDALCGDLTPGQLA